MAVRYSKAVPSASEAKAASTAMLYRSELPLSFSTAHLTPFRAAQAQSCNLRVPSPEHRSPLLMARSSPGEIAATISGTTYAIPSDNSGLVINGQIVPLPTETVLQSVLTVAGQTFTAAPIGFAIDGQNVALDGTVVSLGLSRVQLGSKTIPLASAQATEESLGVLISKRRRAWNDGWRWE